MKTAAIDEKHSSLPMTVANSGSTPNSEAEEHYKGWNNEVAFNALGDQKEKIQLPITGRLPSYVAGILYRNGPGGYKVPKTDRKKGDFAVHHWFDGFTTVHRFELEAGKDGCARAWYSSQSLVDELIEKARKTGKLDGVTFGQKRDPCDTFFKKFKTTFEPTDPPTVTTTNINVTLRDTLPSELKALKGAADGRKTITLGTDNSRSEQIDADTLQPLGIARQAILHPSLTGPMSAAHPAIDPETGDVINYNLDFGPVCTYRIFRTSPSTGKTDILAEFAGNDTKPSYLHSISMTENFVVLCIWPAFYSNFGLPLLLHRNILDAITFDPSAKTTWVVIDRRHGRGIVKKFKSPSFFSFHTTNAWEEKAADGSADLICELVTFKDTSILHRNLYQNLTSTGANTATWLRDNWAALDMNLARYRLPGVPLGKSSPTAKASAEAQLVFKIAAPDAGELPNINPRWAMRAHRYVWGIIDRGKSSFVDGLGKTDTLNRTCLTWEREHHTPGEPIFVPNPEGTEEDDGAILCVVCDGDRGTSYLLCLDARTMQEMGRVEVGRPVGLGFHGLHVPVRK